MSQELSPTQNKPEDFGSWLKPNGEFEYGKMLHTDYVRENAPNIRCEKEGSDDEIALYQFQKRNGWIRFSYGGIKCDFCLTIVKRMTDEQVSTIDNLEQKGYSFHYIYR